MIEDAQATAPASASHALVAYEVPQPPASARSRELVVKAVRSRRDNPMDHLYELIDAARAMAKRRRPEPELVRVLADATRLKREADALRRKLDALGHREESGYCRAPDCPSTCPFAVTDFHAADAYAANNR